MFDFLKKNEFFKALFGREGSGATARERLRLVLLSDHLALAPDVVAALKAFLEHEAREGFRYRGAAIYDPHMPLPALELAAQEERDARASPLDPSGDGSFRGPDGAR